jgi:cystathionine beta-synthase
MNIIMNIVLFIKSCLKLLLLCLLSLFNFLRLKSSEIFKTHFNRARAYLYHVTGLDSGITNGTNERSNNKVFGNLHDNSSVEAESCLKITNCIGNTPLIKLSKNIIPYDNINVFVKLEYYNPSGSIKDRIIKYIINDGIKNGKITNDTILIEASSGNTGSALALISNSYNLSCIICTDTKCSDEKINFMKSFNNTKLTIVKSCSSLSNEHYSNIILKMANDNKNYYHINQYNNTLNSMSYYYGLGPEIWEQVNKNVDYFVCAAGSGGTITGVSKYLKEKNTNLKTILIDPPGSVIGNYFKQKSLISNSNTKTVIEGIGKDSIPGTIDFNYIDDVINIDDNDSISMCYKLANEGIFSGGSGGANVLGALKLAKSIDEQKLNINNTINIVTIIPDSGFKYMSKIFNNEWLKINNITINK